MSLTIFFFLIFLLFFTKILYNQQEISEVLLKYERMVVVTVIDREDAARLVRYGVCDMSASSSYICDLLRMDESFLGRC